jgi:hypothetical protein
MTTRKKTAARPRKRKLAVTKQTLKDLRADRNIRGGFIMKDTAFVRTTGQTC